jgi:molybdopterin molybdotransferase
MLTVEEALARTLELTQALGAEEVTVDEALGRALSEDVLARRTMPPHDNSAMDGYAVRSEDAQRVPVTLQVVEKIFAGHDPTVPVRTGQASRIMTGARMPEGADAVVMQEHATAEGQTVTLGEVVKRRQHVRDAGEDARAGQLLLAKGTALGVPEAGLLWSQGIPRVRVPRRPVVAIVSTGDELVPASEASGDRLVDTNSPALAALVRRAGGIPRLLGIAPDELEAVTRRFEAGLSADLLLTCAGASVGERDFTKDAFARLGVEPGFWKVAMKPGKPLAVGRRGKTLVMGLPGNPTSSLVNFELFVRPALRRMLGHDEPHHSFVRGKLAHGFKKAMGLRHFVRVRGEWRDGELWARPLGTQSSGALSSAAGATHLMSVPTEATEITAGSMVDLLPVSWAG